MDRCFAIFKATLRPQQRQDEASELLIHDETATEGSVAEEQVAGYRLAVSWRPRGSAEQTTHLHVHVHV